MRLDREISDHEIFLPMTGICKNPSYRKECEAYGCVSAAAFGVSADLGLFQCCCHRIAVGGRGGRGRKRVDVGAEFQTCRGGGAVRSRALSVLDAQTRLS